MEFRAPQVVVYSLVDFAFFFDTPVACPGTGLWLTAILFYFDLSVCLVLLTVHTECNTPFDKDDPEHQKCFHPAFKGLGGV
jgi:hypothetical protein